MCNSDQPSRSQVLNNLTMESFFAKRATVLVPLFMWSTLSRRADLMRQHFWVQLSQCPILCWWNGRKIFMVDIRMSHSSSSIDLKVISKLGKDFFGTISECIKRWGVWLLSYFHEEAPFVDPSVASEFFMAIWYWILPMYGWWLI